MAEFLQVLIAGFVASLVWFVLGSVLYVNPLIAKIYKKRESSPGFKVWQSQPKYIITMYFVGALIPCLILAFVYSFLSPAFTGSLILKTLCLGLIIASVRMIPRFFDMWIQTTYPDTLLTIEIVNGTILSFAAAAVLAWLL
ncbi:hypothetical protein KJ903_01020 [Patescibacteria group bacterium]|nr:hypothetical protein [Patescibacteria group bacterium]